MLGFSKTCLVGSILYMDLQLDPTNSDIEQGIIRAGERENYTNPSYLNANNVYKKPKPKL